MPILWKQDDLQATNQWNQSKGKMKFSCNILLPEEVIKVVGQELASFGDRCQMDKKGQEVQIVAKDAVAFRAALNSVGKLVLVYEKAKGL